MTALTHDKHFNYLVGAWLLLMLLTAASWWVGAGHGIAGGARDLSMIGILVLTFAKIYVVGHAFMELREAARWLTVTFSAWCITVCATLSALYLAI